MKKHLFFVFPGVDLTDFHPKTINPMQNRTMPDCTIIPVLAYPDVPQAIDWLCKVFGFTERWRAGTHRAQLSFEGGTITAAEANTANGEIPVSSLTVRVSDMEAHLRRTTEHGAEIIQQPIDYPYGERQYVVRDIGGHIWNFSQSISDVAPEDWGGISGVL